MSNYDTSCNQWQSFSGKIYTQNGVYIDTVLDGATGCDVIITTQLQIDTADTRVVSQNASLEAQATSATYQWVVCPGYSVIALEINKTYEPVTNGLYAVEVTQDGCVDTSDCYTVSTVSVYNSSEKQITIVPNPNHGNFSVVNADIGDMKGVKILNSAGQMVKKSLYHIQNGNEVVTNLNPGIYFIQFQVEGELRSVKLVILK